MMLDSLVPSLGDMQQSMARALLARDAAERAVPEPWFRGPTEARDGLRVHRNTVIGACWNALRLSYPALERWLGEAAFEALAADYARAHPPMAAALTVYGESFREFVVARVNDPDRALARQLADFDRLFERVSHSAPGFDGAPSHLLGGGVELRLAPSLRVHRAPWPIDELRQRLLLGEAASAVVAEPVQLALWRTPAGVVIRRISAAAATLLEALAGDVLLEDALGAAAGSAAEQIESAPAALARILEDEVLRAGFACITVAATADK
jgi:hypothetical protein